MTQNDPLLDRTALAKFFSVQSRSGLEPFRPLRSVLKALGIRLVGGTTRRSVLWRALGLAAIQDPAHHDDLSRPLLKAVEVGDLVGVADPSIVYRWHKGRLPKGVPPFPSAIDLSGGRENARALRWRRAEVLAWHTGSPAPDYAPLPPTFGSLAPTSRRAA